MDSSFLKTLLPVLALVLGSVAKAQLPNEKFGKPSSMEWDFIGWREATDADAVILFKSMKVTYQLTDQVSNNSQDTGIDIDNLQDFGKNQIDESNILVRYEFRLRTKILQPEGARHANIDITYYDTDNGKTDNNDELTDLKIRVFSKNKKGKVEKRSITANAFARERVDANYMVMHVTVPEVQAGDIIEYQYNISSTRPAFLYDWAFQECIPTLYSKCDIDIPAFMQFNINAPINKRIKSSVEAGRLAYDTNRPDMKKGKSCPTNHYVIVGDYILPEGEKIAAFTSQIVTPHVTRPAYMPEGCTHLVVK
ncbi:MAG: DUF3857 domain-containing protein [Bacteroidaceae bacterium]|nr:DUF3857 domain-containing protein [Bacteroidaceae bacterium]